MVPGVDVVVGRVAEGRSCVRLNDDASYDEVVCDEEPVVPVKPHAVVYKTGVRAGTLCADRAHYPIVVSLSGHVVSDVGKSCLNVDAAQGTEPL